MLTEESRGSLKSVYSMLQNDENSRKMKEVSGYLKALKQELGNKQNASRLFEKKKLSIMDECELRLKNNGSLSLENLSDVHCYQFVLSRLAPSDFENIRNRVRIMQVARKKLKNVNKMG